MEIVKALVQLVGTVVAVLAVPLIFMIVFSLVAGFRERLPGDE